MLKSRIIPVQLLLGDRLVKTVRFDSYRDVGNPVSSSKVYSDQDADELVFLNIARDNRSSASLLKLIERVSQVCFMPLAVGGGISSFQDAEQLIRKGADKVVINSAAYRDLNLLSEIASKFGSQAVVVSMDARKDEISSRYVLYSECGRKRELIDLEEHVQKVVGAGAGEILINSIDRDGTMSGYDVDLVRLVVKATNVPVIACGGAGNFEHMKQVSLETRINALACGSLFNFGDNNPIRAKAFLSNYGLSYKVI